MAHEDLFITRLTALTPSLQIPSNELPFYCRGVLPGRTGRQRHCQLTTVRERRKLGWNHIARVGPDLWKSASIVDLNVRTMR